jgi:histidinol-phosphate phosphatase family protein
MMQSYAIFLDRDGVINKHRFDYVKSVQELTILPRVSYYLGRLQALGFKLIIITNQSAVNRGLLSHEQLKAIHDYLVRALAMHGCSIHDIFYCPHTPGQNCECRKPKPRMFLEAARRHNIDLRESWIIGDSDSDIEPGKMIGCKTLRIETNTSLKTAFNIIRTSTRSRLGLQ